MKDISIIYLENNKENIKIVSELILKDISQKCFANKDAEGNIIPIENMAGLYLEYTDMYGIKESDKFIGLLSLTNENEISIFVEPDYQGKGIGKWLLAQAFIKIIHVAEITGLYFIIVDAKETSKGFYEHFGFIKFNDKEQSYFLPVDTVRKAMQR